MDMMIMAIGDVTTVNEKGAIEMKDMKKTTTTIELETGHMTGDQGDQRWISPSSMGGIHMSGWTKWTTISVSMKYQEMRGCRQHVFILKGEQASGGVGYATNMTKKGDDLGGRPLKKSS